MGGNKAGREVESQRLLKSRIRPRKRFEDSQFGMLMPAGMPEVAKERISSAVKSGRLKTSTTIATRQLHC